MNYASRRWQEVRRGFVCRVHALRLPGRSRVRVITWVIEALMVVRARQIAWVLYQWKETEEERHPDIQTLYEKL